MRSVRTAMMGVGLGWVLGAAAQPAEVMNFALEAQPLNAALDAWATQTGWQFVVASEVLDQSAMSPGVIGSVTATQALQQLLTNSTIDYEFVNAHTVSLRDGLAATPSASAATLASVQAFSVAAAVAPTSLGEQDEVMRIALDEIVVTGTRLRNADGVTPAVVIDRERIDELGASSVTDVLRYLPQQSFTRAESSSPSQYAQIRGLGVGNTLVLINGRRTVLSATSIAFNGFDLNSIPLALVERVEVLSESASAVYGADAIGGVINVVLKSAVDRPEAEVHFGAADDGARERRAALSLGHLGERFDLGVGVDVFDREPLIGADRARTANADFRRFGGVDRRVLYANPGNIASLDGEPLPGLPSSFAAVPDGQGTNLSPADFLATAGQSNYESLARYATLISEAQRLSATATAQFRVNEHWQLFAEGMYADRETWTEAFPAVLADELIPASNAFNPFGVDVAASYIMNGLGPLQTHIESELSRAVAGVRVGFAGWEAEVSALRARETATSTDSNDVSFGALTSSLASADPALAFNVFGSGPGGSPALLDALRAEATIDTYESNGTVVGAFARGPVVTLPAGDLEMVVGGEWQTQEAFADFTSFVDSDREAYAAFVEAHVPLVSTAQNLPVESLSLTLAGRYDDYSDFGTTVNPKVGFTWAPTADLSIRGSWGTSFRPPSLFELYSPRTVRTLQVIDVVRGNEVIRVPSLSGGNPQLEATEAESLSLGAQFAPRALPALRASLTYWQIELDQRVSVLSTIVLLANESRFPERIARRAPTAEDVAAGRPGRLSFIDTSRLNYGRIETAGIDMELRYAWDTSVGRFSPLLAATWVNEYDAIDLPNTPALNRVNHASGLGTILRWRVVGGLNWQWHGVGVGVTARYAPSYAGVDPLNTQPTGRAVDAQTMFDLQATFDVDHAFASGTWARDLKLTVGAINLLDEEPPYAAIGFDFGIDSSQGDLRQRFVYASLSKRW